MADKMKRRPGARGYIGKTGGPARPPSPRKPQPEGSRFAPGRASRRAAIRSDFKGVRSSMGNEAANKWRNELRQELRTPGVSAKETKLIKQGAAAIKKASGAKAAKSFKAKAAKAKPVTKKAPIRRTY